MDWLTIPDHELLRCIGRGAYGAVWLARNVMGTYRAIKIVHREDFGRDRPFVREYEGLLNFEPISRSHPNLMQILHVGRHPDYFYYVTELADDAGGQADGGRRTEDDGTWAVGEGRRGVGGLLGGPGDSSVVSYVPRTLQEDLERRDRLPVRECVSLATALASALKHLHDRELVHRDVKPSNVIFVHGVPKLADIGLVATVGDSRSIVGTEGYLPPEGPGSPQADLYALGKLLYESSTGMNRGEYPRLPQNLRELPDAAELLEFNEVLLRACAKDTDRRYHRADELLADLALIERGASVKRLRRLERHHAVLKRAGVGVLAIGLLISGAWWQSWRARQTVRRHLAWSHVSSGTQRMVQGDYAAALPWLVGALELDAGDRASEQVHRTRIAGVLECCPLPVGQFSVPNSKVLAADLKPDGGMVATAHEDGGVRLWDVRTGECREIPHDFPVVLCQFLPSGDRLLTVTLGQRAHLWDLANPGGKAITFDQVMGFRSVGYSVGLNQRLGRAYLSKGVRRFARSHELSDSLERGPLENLRLGLKLVGEGNALRVRYEVRRPTPDNEVLYAGELQDTPKAEPFAYGLDNNPSGPMWGSAFLTLENASVGDRPGDRSRLVWDNLRVRRYPSEERPPAWQILDDFSGPELSHWLHVSPEGLAGACRVVDGQLVLTCDNLPTVHYGWSCAMRLDLFENDGDHTLEFEVDLVSAQAPHVQAALGLCWPRPSPDTAPDRPYRLDERLLILTWTDWSVRFWDLKKGEFVTLERDGRAVPLVLQVNKLRADLSVSPDAKHLAGVGTGRCAVWDLGTGRQLDVRALARLQATGARFSPDGRFLAVSHADGLELIGTWDWQPVLTLGSDASFRKPRFSPCGGRLAAVSDSETVVVWDLGDRTQQPARFAHRFEVSRIAFSPDGRYLASSSADGLVRVWDVIRRERFGPPLPGILARFSADGTQLLLLGRNGVWLWDLGRVKDDSLAVPPLCVEQRFVTSADRALTAEIADRSILLETPDGRYSMAGQDQIPWRRLAFSPDGQHLIAESSDRRVWTWDLLTRTLIGPPKPGRYDPARKDYASVNLPVDRRHLGTLSDLAALLGRQRPDGEGGMIPMEEVEQARLFAELKKAHPSEFSVDEADRVRWHGAQAQVAEQAMSWDAAVFHWERVQRVKSDISVDERLAYARQADAIVRKEMAAGHSRYSVPLPRPPWATPEMLDLGSHYTLSLGELLAAGRPGASFGGLAGGTRNLGGTDFDVRGIVRLDREKAVIVPVGRVCARIHFLNASGQKLARHGLREPVGRYQVTYAGGEQVSVYLMNPEDAPPYDAGDFFESEGAEWAGTTAGLRCAMVLSGCPEGGGALSEIPYLTRTSWELPGRYRGQIVERLELRGGSTESALLVFAITIE